MVQIQSLLQQDKYYIVIFSLYTLNRAYKTYTGRSSSGYKTNNVNTYATWGIDYVRFDSCNTKGTPLKVEYLILRNALNAAGRSIFYSLYGMHQCFFCFLAYCLLFYRSRMMLINTIYGHLNIGNGR